MKKMVIIAMLIATALTAHAQTPPNCASPTSFMEWVSCQQAHVGVGYFIKDDTAKYATTWWDLVQFGKGYGANVAQPNNALDYVDFGPATAGANDRTQRWGLAVPIHVGNIWNAIKGNNNVVITKLPPLVAGLMFMWPAHGSLSTWQWHDVMGSITYGFGGS